MNIFLKHLRDEHDLITDVLAKCERYFLNQTEYTDKQIPFLSELIFFTENFMQNCHHKKEEELLFPKINLSPIVYQGGPYCTHYYQFHIEYQRFEQSQELAHQFGITLPKRILSPSVQQIIDHRNALMVPLEDHWACQNYMEIFKHLIQLLTKQIELDPILIRRSLIGYIGLINQHTEKENNCLFMMANELLDAKTQDELYQRAIEQFSYDQTRITHFVKTLSQE